MTSLIVINVYYVVMIAQLLVNVYLQILDAPYQILEDIQLMKIGIQK